MNRLTNVTNKDASQVSYTYDNLGNRLTKTDSSGTTNYAYDDANQLTSESKPGGEVIAYTYDENGNTTIKNSNTGGITTYSYDNKNQLVKVTKPNMDVIEFIYNAEGTRTEKKVNGVSTFYQYDTNGNIVLETDFNKNIKVKYIRDTEGKALAQEQNNQTYYYLYNAHGDVTGLTDSSGNTVANYTYDEFGNLKSSTGNVYNPLRYLGANNAYYDEETGLYKMGVRYYDSSIGRWLTRDRAVYDVGETQTHHEYVYSLNNPIMRIDPSGYKSYYVYAVYDDEWHKLTGSHKKAQYYLKKRIEESDNVFEKMGIDFKIKRFGYWHSDSSSKIGAAFEMIKETGWYIKKFRYNLDRMIGISGVKNGGGVTGPPGIYDVIYFRNSRSFKWDSHILRHEMGHLSPWVLSDGGYGHKCIMNYKYFAQGYYDFDKKCKEAIKQAVFRTW